MQQFSLAQPWSKLNKCDVDAVCQLPFCNVTDPVVLEIHVGGSGAGVGPWVFAVLWKSPQGVWPFGGYRVGPIVCDATDPEYIGSTDHGPNGLVGWRSQPSPSQPLYLSSWGCAA